MWGKVAGRGGPRHLGLVSTSSFDISVLETKSATYEEEFPSNIRKRTTRRLKINQIRKCNTHHTKTNPLAPNMIRKQLAIKHHTRNIHAERVDQQEDVESSDSDCEARFVGAFVGVESYHGGFDAKADAAACDAEDHQGFAAETVHY